MALKPTAKTNATTIELVDRKNNRQQSTGESWLLHRSCINKQQTIIVVTIAR
jgi:hypothetical protein